ncbi:MAG: EscU/YscU/HrcU family type III secretion system export apparatus switch protein, partial [Burkholderiaceae bacterium]
MSEPNDDQERNLEPSQKRLDDARREGRVPRSRDLAHLAVLGGAAGGFLWLSGSMFESARRVMRAGLSFDAETATVPTRMAERLVMLAGEALWAVAPLLALLVVAAVAAPLLVGGWVFSWTAMAPKLSKLSPLAGFKRMFSLQSLVQLGKVILIAILLGAVGFWYVASHLDEFASLAQQSLPAAVAHFGGMFVLAFSLMVGTLAAAAAIDVPFQLFQHHSKLKMTL